MTHVPEERRYCAFSPALVVDDDYLAFWLHQVTTRLRREICWLWHQRKLQFGSEATGSSFSSMFVEKGIPEINMVRFWEEKQDFFESDPTAKYLSQRLQNEPPINGNDVVHGSLFWLANQLKLDYASLFVLSIGLGFHLDNAMESVIPICFNDPSKTRPTIGLAQRLWDHPGEIILSLSDPSNILFQMGFLKYPFSNSGNVNNRYYDGEIRVSPIVANQILFPTKILPRDLKIIKNHAITENEVDMDSNLLSFISIKLKHNGMGSLHVVPILGKKGSSHRETAAKISYSSGRDLVEFIGDPRLLEDFEYLNSIALLCWFRNLNLFLDDNVVSLLMSGDANSVPRFLPSPSIPITIFLGITEEKYVKNISPQILIPMIKVPQLSFSDRVFYLNKFLNTKIKGLDDTILEYARRFRVEKESLIRICEELESFPGEITEADLMNAYRSEVEMNLGELAQKVIPRFAKDELVLPQKQHRKFEEVIKGMRSLTRVHYEWGTAKSWNESGIAVLFAGPSGSGKTMAAEVLANELNLPMYRIDLSQVVNKYIGETEKNLKTLFDTAEICDMLLFFDEADSLFGRRTDVRDAHDRYANLTVSYLLERMERFKGLAILSTNRKKDLDESFLRRLRYIIDFPIPGEEQRRTIWKQSMPRSIDYSDVDVDFLARQFQLTGGNIRSIVFNACLQSINSHGSKDTQKKLTMEKIIISLKREYEKIGRSITLEQFGPHAEIIRKMEEE